jgi:hypothetical protein
MQYTSPFSPKETKDIETHLDTIYVLYVNGKMDVYDEMLFYCVLRSALLAYSNPQKWALIFQYINQESHKLEQLYQVKIKTSGWLTREALNNLFPVLTRLGSSLLDKMIKEVKVGAGV